MWLKLNGEIIIGHHNGTPDDPENYHVEIPERVLVNSDGNYIYKYSGGQLVLLDQADIDNHPNKTNKAIMNKFWTLVKLDQGRETAQRIIDNAQVPQNIKDYAAIIKAQLNQEILDLLGL